MELSVFKNNFETFWFKLSDASVLALSRIIFFSTLIVMMGPSLTPEWAQVPSEFWRPISFFKFFEIMPPQYATLDFLISMWRASVFLMVLGFMTPLSGLVTSALSLYLFGIRSCYGFVPSSDSTIIFFSLIFSLSPCAQIMSIDAFIRRRWKNWFRWNLNRVTEWPFELCFLVWTMTFYSAGISKLYQFGFNWIWSQTFENQLLHNLFWYRSRSFEEFDLGRVLIEHSLIGRLFALFMIGFQLTVPISFIFKKLRLFYLLCCLLIQIALVVIFRVEATESFIVYLVLFLKAARDSEWRLTSLSLGK